MGGKSTSTSDARLAGIQIQTSTLGLPYTLCWGRVRIKANLIWYNAFTATPHTTKTSAGKGLGGSSSNTTYSYTASIMMALCEGPITDIRTVYRDKSIFGPPNALSAAGLSLATGTPTQPVWGYLTSMYPSQARTYSRIAYVYAQDYALNDGATLPNHSFEIDAAIQLPGLADADPSAILTDYLTNPQYGVPGWPTGIIGDLSDWSLYCRASNLLLSPALETQVTGSDPVTEWTDATNSAIFFSEGFVKVRPYGDRATTANGVTWTPNLTPVYDLTEEDFTDEGPVKVQIMDQTDAYNVTQVECLDRTNQYNTAVVASTDDANIEVYGVRKADPVTWHSICDTGIAKTACDLLLGRSLYKRLQYTFTLPEDFALLEPTDLVTLTTATDALLLNRQLVRIIQIDEAEDGALSITAEHVDVGTAATALYVASGALGYQPNFDAPPGNVATPMIFNAPTSLQTNGPEVWCAAAGQSPAWGGANVWISLDNASYSRVGTLNGPARYGDLSAALAANPDPDTTDTLAVDLTISGGVLGPATQAEADAAASLCYVDGELVAYRDATLTAASRYNLGYLRRGQRGTVSGAHAAGASFARLDDAIFKFAYPTNAIGQTVYVKFQSFNVFGRATQDLSTCTAYTVGVGPPPPPVPLGWSLAGTTLTINGASITALVATAVAGNPYADTVLFEVRQSMALQNEDGTIRLNENGSVMYGEGSDLAWMTQAELPAATTLNWTTSSGIVPTGVYEVGVSYRTNGVLGSRQVLGPVTAGAVPMPASAQDVAALEQTVAAQSVQIGKLNSRLNNANIAQE